MKTTVCVTALCILALSNASAAEVRLRLTGTAFEGGPAYTMQIGDQTIGSGTLDPILPEGTLIIVDVDDAMLRSTDPFIVRLTNDRYQADVGDRNLQVMSASVAGAVLKASDFIIMRDGKPLTAAHPDGMIFAGLDEAVAAAPAAGWLPMADQPTPKAEAKPAMAAAVSASPLPPVPARRPSPCDASVDITEFVHGVATLAPAATAKLQDIADQAAGGDCAVAVLGYASTTGSAAVNMTLSAARARAVMDQLSALASFTNATVAGRGETTQFGSDAAANRRVTVHLSR